MKLLGAALILCGAALQCHALLGARRQERAALRELSAALEGLERGIRVSLMPLPRLLGQRGAVTAFTLYLSVSGVLTGSADRAAVKAAQTAVSGAVPVVGSILAESAEMVLSAAHSLRAAIGAAGVLGVLLACLAPLVRLGVQFLLYRAAAFVSAVSGVKPLERLLEQLGDAFALVLGMTAACAALLLAALLVSISMVVM